MARKKPLSPFPAKPPTGARAKSPAARDPIQKRSPPHTLTRFADRTGVKATATDVENAKTFDIMGLLWLSETPRLEDQEALIVMADDLLADLKPKSGLEAMLAKQMIGTHLAAMACMKRATTQPPAASQAALAQAQSLMGLFTKQVATLDKHRGNGEQKVTVEHVHVAAGGQAIVGNSETPKAAAAPLRRKVAPPQLEYHVAVPNPLDSLAAKPAIRNRVRTAAHD